MAANKKVITRNEIRNVATWGSDSGAVEKPRIDIPVGGGRNSGWPWTEPFFT
jgi:hypothetical protein